MQDTVASVIGNSFDSRSNQCVSSKIDSSTARNRVENVANTGAEGSKLMEAQSLHHMACPINDVVAFICAVCRHVFPSKTVWGSRHNQNSFLSSISEYLRLGRHEQMSYKHIVMQMTINDIPWLQLDKKKRSFAAMTEGLAAVAGKSKKCKLQLKVSNSSEEFCESSVLERCRIALLYGFLVWLFDSFINPLISTTFYVTEGEGYCKNSNWADTTHYEHRQVHFYLHSTWSAIVKYIGYKQMDKLFMEVRIVYLQFKSTTSILCCVYRLKYLIFFNDLCQILLMPLHPAL
jgi:hypothetical protein